MNINECELPGIGRKFETITANNDRIVIIIHDDGNREVYHYDDNDDEESISGVTFTDQEARQFASIMGGMVYQPKTLESINLAINDLIIEWHKIDVKSPIANKTIGEYDVRNNYNITIIAIIKKETENLLAPGPDSRLVPGDTIILSGARKDVKRIYQDLLAKGRD
ncbi:cation:proton antiporter regulatory subunit [Paenisporosarcina indica]|uniref:cation:proton antiporter regulatory subunit n=1 Tax=Paenisporosarcina indica TaxID=650093 RepID=UPI00094F6475|nr:cation:proton antiporter regulatory subunit [Paenisporosarcina indica]